MKGDILMPGPEKMNTQIKSMINAQVIVTGYNFLGAFQGQITFCNL